MGTVNGRLTVFFEEPFWVGVFERVEDGKLSVAKVTFGSEPKDYEIYEFILKHYGRLEFSPAMNAQMKEAHANPKKMQRDIGKQLKSSGIGTKSQQALKLQYEQNKLERKAESRERRLCEEQRQFEMKQQKKKEKHKGH